jgi:uroporphyrin-III C-methyltransferase / precorrin-2 dehydrogenase / sirohydrochlorin ferrochelatase
MRNLLPLFLDVSGRDVLLVGGGRVAAAKLQQLLAAGARVRVVSPDVSPEIGGGEIRRRPFEPSDLDGVWLVVAAATPEVNRQVAETAGARHVFVNAVDDPANATAYLTGVVRRDDVTIAISTSGDAPALTALLREALDAVLPRDLGDWVATAREQRAQWRRGQVPMERRKPLLLQALNRLYGDGSAVARLKPRAPADLERERSGERLNPRSEREPPGERLNPRSEREPSGERIPWLSGPEDSWL